MVNIVEKYTPRRFSAFCTDGGVVLCESEGGAFLVLRFPEEAEALRLLLSTIRIEQPTPDRRT